MEVYSGLLQIKQCWEYALQTCSGTLWFYLDLLKSYAFAKVKFSFKERSLAKFIRGKEKAAAWRKKTNFSIHGL